MDKWPKTEYISGFPLNSRENLLIGRGRTSAIPLTDPHVSKTHCQVEWEGEALVLSDQGSRTGTHVNGVRISRQPLRVGDFIRIGETQLRVIDDSLLPVARDEPETLTEPIPPGVLASPLLALLGKTLGDYTIESILGHGTCGIVFKAHETRNNRLVALKVFAPDFLQDDEAVQRFIRAMRIMLPLRHPNLVAIQGAGKTGNLCWLTMEYVDGDSLAQLLRQESPMKVLAPPFVLRVAVHLARALDYASHSAIVHRNITPSNVIIRGSDQTAKLGDLVLAKTLQGMLVENITRPGELVGEVRYMSPERVMGNQELDSRSDIYSLGALIYTLLTGRPPFEGPTVSDTLVLICQGEPERPSLRQPSLAGPLEEAMLRMLRKRPEDRYRTAAELVLELEAIAKQAGVVV